MQVNFINEKATGLSKVSFIIQSQFTFGQGIQYQRVLFIQKQSSHDIKHFKFQLLLAPEPIYLPSSVIKSWLICCGYLMHQPSLGHSF